jgi:hypothetical protein
MESRQERRDISGVYRFMDTWVKRNGKRQAVATKLQP